MTTRREVLWALAAALSAGLDSTLAKERRIPRVGLLSLQSGELLEPVRAALRELGYIDGKNIHLEERAAGDEYARLAAIAAEFVKLSVDVIVAGGATATKAARRVTSATPIVMITGLDPVAHGLAVSLARPGGNVTGLRVTGGTDLAVKRFELAKELVPRLTRVALLLHGESGAALVQRTDVETAAKAAKLNLRVIEVHSSGDLEAGFDQIRRTAQLVIVPPASAFNANRARIIELAALSRVPAIYGSGEWVESGGLASYGSDMVKARREAARYVDKILRGVKPSELPIEEAKTIDVVVNLRTARVLGLKMPEVVLLRATKVIE